MNMLVTGGAGFIGSHLVEALVREGHRVRVLDNLSSGRCENLHKVRDDIELITGDVRDPDICRRACAGIERVWHQAAIVSVPLSVEDPLTCHEVNLTGTLHLLQAARDAGVRRLVMASSCAVYGNEPTLPSVESLRPLPLSPYAATKLAAEHYLRQFTMLYGLETVALRYFNIFGPRQDPTGQYAGVVCAFIAAMLEGRALNVYGDGEQCREFTYVDDCVQANLLAGLREGKGIVGEVFNVAVGNPTTVNALLAACRQALGVVHTPDTRPARAGDIRYSVASIEKAVTRLGFHPCWSLEQGLHETIAWYRDALLHTRA